MKSSQLALLYNWQSTAPAPMPFKVMSAYTQGHDEVYFLAPDPIFLPKMLISDPKNNENFDPWPVFVVSLIPDSMRKTMLVPVPRNVNPDPWLRSLIPALLSPLIPDPVYLVTTLLSRFMVSFQDE